MATVKRSYEVGASHAGYTNGSSDKNLSLITGAEDGMVRWYQLSEVNTKTKTAAVQPKVVLETKSGPVQCIVLHDVTKFKKKDLVVADSCGILTVFFDHQIVFRQKIYDTSINCLQILQDSTNNTSILTSDDTGIISAGLLSTHLWKINLNDSCVHQEGNQHVTVTSMLACDLSNQHGQVRSYVLVADNSQQLHVLYQGTIVLTLKITSNVTSMCQGRFVGSNKLEQSNGQNGSSNQSVSQIALGTESGAVYVFHNFNISADEYANCHHPITNLKTLHVPEGALDILLCSGHFNALHLYLDGTKLTSFTTSDWINTLDTADIDDDGNMEIIVGCMDTNIYALKPRN